MQLLDLHVGRHVHRGALTLFPVWNGRAVGARGYVPGGDVVQVAEREGAAVVAQLVVTNPAPRPALVLEGDLLEGASRTASRTARCSCPPAAPRCWRCRASSRGGGTAAVGIA